MTIRPTTTVIVEEPVAVVELTKKDAAVLSAILACVRSGKIHNLDNTGIYNLYSDLCDFIDDNDARYFEQHREIVGQAKVQLL